MIKGIGTDIVSVNRIEKAIKNISFLKKYFTKKEIELFEKRKNNIEIIAGNFAAKEATAKAFLTGFSGFMPIDIEILRDKKGCPFINFYNNAEKIRKEKNIDKMHISISNEKEYVIAYVIAEEV